MMRILKTTVPIDDQWHEIEVGDRIVHVGQQGSLSLTVWFAAYDDADADPPKKVEARVYGPVTRSRVFPDAATTRRTSAPSRPEPGSCGIW